MVADLSRRAIETRPLAVSNPEFWFASFIGRLISFSRNAPYNYSLSVFFER